MAKNLKQLASNVFTVKMFSKKAWEKVGELCGSFNPQTVRDEFLFEKFMDFLDLWMEDNNVLFDDIYDPEIRGDEFVYYNELTDEEVSFPFDLQMALVDRYSECLLGD